MSHSNRPPLKIVDDPVSDIQQKTDEQQWREKILSIHDRIDKSMQLEKTRGAHSFESRLVRAHVNTWENTKKWLLDVAIVVLTALIVVWILG